MHINWTSIEEDHSPFGDDEHFDRIEYYSFVVTVIIFLIGFIGNLTMSLVNVYILRRSFHGEKRTLENILLEISLFDSILLIYHLTNVIVRHQSRNEIDPMKMTGIINTSHVTCKLLTYIVRVSTSMSHWLMIVLVCNRLFLVYPNFHRLIAIVNAKYAVLGLLFVFTVFNVPSIESISFNENLSSLANSSFHPRDHCLLNVELNNLESTIESRAVLFNVFFFNFLGLICPTILIVPLSIFLLKRGAKIWNQLHSNENDAERISLRYDSPILDYLRTYKSVFYLSLVFFLLSTPSKIFRLFVLFGSSHVETLLSSRFFFRFHGQMETVGQAFELFIYSYKCYVCFLTNYRFRCAMKYLFTYRRREILLDQHRLSRASSTRNRRHQSSRSDEGSPLDIFNRPMKTDQFDSANVSAGLFSQRSSFKTRSSVSSRRTKEDEISL